MLACIATEVNQLVVSDWEPAAQTATSGGGLQNTWSQWSYAELQDERHVRQRHAQLHLLRRQQGDLGFIDWLLCFALCEVMSLCYLQPWILPSFQKWPPN